MTLLDEAVKLQTTAGVACAVGSLKKLDPTLYAELLEGLASTVQAAALSRALKGHSILMAPDVLSRHRRGDCVSCRS